VPVVLPRVQNITVHSPALGGYADPVIVVLPPGYASHPLQRYPVLYLLHGFPGAGLGFLDIGQVGTTEATLVAAGRMQPVIMVIPAGTRSFLADEEWANGIREGNNWDTFVARDLVNAIDARYRTRATPGGRGIAGLSEDGLAFVSLQLAFQRGTALATAGVSTLLTNVLPILAGLIIFAEHLPGGAAGIVRALGFAASVLGATMLAATGRAGPVREAVAANPTSPDT